MRKNPTLSVLVLVTGNVRKGPTGAQLAKWSPFMACAPGTRPISLYDPVRGGGGW